MRTVTCVHYINVSMITINKVQWEEMYNYVFISITVQHDVFTVIAEIKGLKLFDELIQRSENIQGVLLEASHLIIFFKL